MMTNKEFMESLSPDDQKDFMDTYSRSRITCYDYVDWDAWWNAEKGVDVLDKIKCLYDYTDEKGNKYFVLEKFLNEEYQMNYVRIYGVCEDSIYEVPANEDETIENYEYDVHEDDGVFPNGADIATGSY